MTDRARPISGVHPLLRAAAVLAVFALGGCNRYSDDEWMQYRALQASEDARNSGVSIAFDPATTAIVSDNRDHRLLTDYAIDAVWRRGTVDSRRGYLVHRLGATSHCDEATMRPVIKRIGGDTSLFNGAQSPDNPVPTGTCVVTLPARMDLPVLRADHLEQATEIDDLEVVRVTVLVTDHAGNRYRLHALRPSLGNSDRRSMPADVLARAIGLARREGRPPFTIAAIDADIARLDGTMFERDRAALEALLAAPLATTPPQSRFAAITSSPDRSTPYAARAVAALGQAVDADDGGRIGGEALVDFVAALPARSVTNHGQELIGLFNRPAPPDWLLRDELMQRLGDVGPAAVPVITDLLGKGRHIGALAALCQIAPVATPELRNALIERWTKANEPRTYTRTHRRRRNRGWIGRTFFGDDYRYRRRTYQTAAVLGSDSALLYVTMIRVGMRADAERLARHRWKDDWAQESAAIGSRSHATVCTTDLPRLSF